VQPPYPGDTGSLKMSRYSVTANVTVFGDHRCHGIP